MAHAKVRQSKQPVATSNVTCTRTYEYAPGNYEGFGHPIRTAYHQPLGRRYTSAGALVETVNIQRRECGHRDCLVFAYYDPGHLTGAKPPRRKRKKKQEEEA